MSAAPKSWSKYTTPTNKYKSFHLYNQVEVKFVWQTSPPPLTNGTCRCSFFAKHLIFFFFFEKGHRKISKSHQKGEESAKFLSNSSNQTHVTKSYTRIFFIVTIFFHIRAPSRFWDLPPGLGAQTRPFNLCARKP